MDVYIVLSIGLIISRLCGWNNIVDALLFFLGLWTYNRLTGIIQMSKSKNRFMRFLRRTCCYLGNREPAEEDA